MKRGLKAKRRRREFRARHGIDMVTWVGQEVEKAMVSWLLQTVPASSSRDLSKIYGLSADQLLIDDPHDPSRAHISDTPPAGL